jgi:hypothetical protein
VLRGDVPGVAGEETDDSGTHRGRSIAAGRGGRNPAEEAVQAGRLCVFCHKEGRRLRLIRVAAEPVRRGARRFWSRKGSRG